MFDTALAVDEVALWIAEVLQAPLLPRAHQDYRVVVTDQDQFSYFVTANATTRRRGRPYGPSRRVSARPMVSPRGWTLPEQLRQGGAALHAGPAGADAFASPLV